MATAALQIVHQVVLTSRTCGECGIAFAMPEEKEKRCREKGEDFYCPNGHCRVFSENEISRLRKMVEEGNRKNTELTEWLNQERAAREKADKEARRIKKRIHAGVCPCCNRTFQNLARHMATKHPTQND